MAWSYQKCCSNLSEIPIKEISNTIPYSEWMSLFWEGQFFVFEYEGGFVHPINGSADIVGIGKDYRVQPKSYDLKEFVSLLQTCSKSLICFPDGFQVNPLEFRSVKIIRHKDYPKMITDLEKSNYIATNKSKNILSTDGRAFKLLSTIEEDYLKEYVGKEYEVDCLGTAFCKIMSDDIEKFYKTHCLKNISIENQVNQ